MGTGGRVVVRLATVVATLAAVLVPAWIAPAQTISTPVTMAQTVRLDAHLTARRPAGALRLAFPATHIAFSWAGPEDVTITYRTDPDGVWHEAPIAHDAETATHHYTGVLAVPRAEQLEWNVESPHLTAIEDLTLDYLNTLDGPRVTRDLPATADAEARTPKIVTRAQWGADESLKRTTGGCRRRFYPLQQLFVHHTAGANFDTRPKATMRAIYWYHVVRQGWCDIGYNFVVSHDGRVFEGRWARDYNPWEVHDSESRDGRVVSGAHVDGYNSGTVGISVMGNFETAKPSPATRRALAEFLAWEVDRHDLRARGTHTYRNPETGATRTLPWIAGHRDADATSCPGNYLYSKLPALRRDTALVMGEGKTSTSVRVTASSRRISYGDGVTITGTLTDANGVVLPARVIRTYVKEGLKQWIEGPSATTAPNGTFAFALQPKANLKLVAIYDGDSETWGSESGVRVRVAPDVTLQAEGAFPDTTGAYHYPAGTDRVTLFGQVTPAHTGRNVQIRIRKVQSDGTVKRIDEGSAQLDRNGGFVFDWDVVDPGVGGTYHAHALFPKDDDHARGVSPVITFVIDPQP
ncbi:MAG: N-acetylmuramoyl-L-alanine amidase [Actinobacteria bacterium]|nr:N-acetylmuramoyl-L-alanine amidase [Actinomycetota bacterium]